METAIPTIVRRSRSGSEGLFSNDPDQDSLAASFVLNSQREYDEEWQEETPTQERQVKIEDLTIPGSIRSFSAFLSFLSQENYFHGVPYSSAQYQEKLEEAKVHWKRREEKRTKKKTTSEEEHSSSDDSSNRDARAENTHGRDWRDLSVAAAFQRKEGQQEQRDTRTQAQRDKDAWDAWVREQNRQLTWGECRYHFDEERKQEAQKKWWKQQETEEFRAQEENKMTQEEAQEREKVREETIVNELRQQNEELRKQLLASLSSNSKSKSSLPFTCSWRFSHYVSSSWESHWRSIIGPIEREDFRIWKEYSLGRTSESSYGVCEQLLKPEEREKSIYLIARIQELARRANVPAWNRLNETVGPPYLSSEEEAPTMKEERQTVVRKPRKVNPEGKGDQAIPRWNSTGTRYGRRKETTEAQEPPENKWKQPSVQSKPQKRHRAVEGKPIKPGATTSSFSTNATPQTQQPQESTQQPVQQTPQERVDPKSMRSNTEEAMEDQDLDVQGASSTKSPSPSISVPQLQDAEESEKQRQKTQFSPSRSNDTAKHLESSAEDLSYQSAIPSAFPSSNITGEEEEIDFDLVEKLMQEGDKLEEENQLHEEEADQQNDPLVDYVPPPLSKPARSDTVKPKTSSRSKPSRASPSKLESLDKSGQDATPAATASADSTVAAPNDRVPPIEVAHNRRKKLKSRVPDAAGEGASSPSTAQQNRRLLSTIDAGAKPQLRIGTVEHMRDVADPLFSRMHYELRCTLGGAVEEFSAESDDSFVIATGFDMIEPLVGLLRDPLSICDQPRWKGIPSHMLRFYDYEASQDVQSKQFLLLQPATPYHLEVMEDTILPSYLQGLDLPDKISTALDRIASGSGTAPWYFRSPSKKLTISGSGSDVPVDWQFQSRPKKPSYGSREVIKKDGSIQRIQSLLSEEEEQTSIQVDSSGSVSIPWTLSSGSSFIDPLTRRRSDAAPRTFLFDLGASYFGGWDRFGSNSKEMDTSALGSAWFYQQLKMKGLNIDRVYAWEYQVLDPVVEWKMIPSELYAEFTFINAGVTADPKAATNPWNTILAVTRPTDYVIVKLDIDTSSIEVPLVQQLLDTPQLQRLVDEMFFEHHVKIREMERYWFRDWGDTTILQTYEWYTTLRQAGIRMHSWP